MPAQSLANVSSALSIRLRVESLTWRLSLEDNKFCVRAGVGEFLCGVNRTTQVEAAVDQDIDQRRQAFVQKVCWNTTNSASVSTSNIGSLCPLTKSAPSDRRGIVGAPSTPRQHNCPLTPPAVASIKARVTPPQQRPMLDRPALPCSLTHQAREPLVNTREPLSDIWLEVPPECER